MNKITFTNLGVVKKEMFADGKLAKLRVVEDLYRGKKMEEMKKKGKQVKAYYNVNLWDKLADVANKYVEPGNKISISGTLLNEQYTDKDGNKRESAVINADSFEFLPSTSKPSQSETNQSETQTEDSDESSDLGYPVDEEDDDIPF